MDSSLSWKENWVEIEKCMGMLNEEGQQQLGQKLRRLYSQYELPIEVRQALAGLIEAVSNEDLGQEEADGEGTELYNEIIQELKRLAKEKTFPVNSGLADAIEIFKNRYDGNPISLRENIKKCLTAELEIIEDAKKNCQHAQDNRNFYREGCYRISGIMKQRKQHADVCEKLIYDLQGKLEELPGYQVLLDKLTKKSGKNQGNKTDRTKKAEKDVEVLLLKYNVAIEDKNKCLQESQAALCNLCTNVLVQVHEVWKYIDEYEKQHKLSILEINKGPPEGALKDLNDVCESVNEVLVQLAQLFKSMSEVHKLDCNNELNENVQSQQEIFICDFKRHIERIVVIDAQPPQVMKVSKNRRLSVSMSLRILGPVGLGLKVNRPKASAYLHQERSLPKEMEPGRDVSQGMTIKNAQGIEGKFINSTKQLTVNFNPVYIENLKRPADDHNREERVTERKYGIIFSVHLTVANNTHNVKKLSLPVILTTQSSQEWAAKGTLMWDAAFSEDNRDFYEDAPRVQWEQLTQLLNLMFLRSSGRGLEKYHFDCMAERVSGGQEVFTEISKEKFLRENLSDAQFSLWKWVYGCLNLIKHSLKNEWQRGLILGFVSRAMAEELLTPCDVGTFLLRFKASTLLDSQSAAITAILAPSAVVDLNGGHRRVSHVDANLTQPYLAKRNLARFLQQSQVPTNPETPNVKSALFKTLYPDVPFDNAFGDLIKEEEKKKTNYDSLIEKAELQLADLTFGPGSVPASPASSSITGMSTYSEETASPSLDVLGECMEMILEDGVDCVDDPFINANMDLLNDQAMGPAVEVQQVVTVDPNGGTYPFTGMYIQDDATTLTLQNL